MMVLGGEASRACFLGHELGHFEGPGVFGVVELPVLVICSCLVKTIIH